MNETPDGVLETYDWQDVAEEYGERIRSTRNFLKHLRATFDKNDEMYDLLSEAMSLLDFKGDRDE